MHHAVTRAALNPGTAEENRQRHSNREQLNQKPRLINDKNLMLIFYRNERLTEPEERADAIQQQNQVHHAEARAALNPGQAEENRRRHANSETVKSATQSKAEADERRKRDADFLS